MMGGGGEREMKTRDVKEENCVEERKLVMKERARDEV